MVLNIGLFISTLKCVLSPNGAACQCADVKMNSRRGSKKGAVHRAKRKRNRRRSNKRRRVNSLLHKECQLSLCSKPPLRQSPHPLFIVSRTSLGKYWNNTVVVVDGNRDYPEQVKQNGTVYYQRVDYVGPDIRHEWANSTRTNPFDLSAVPNNALIVVTPITRKILDDNVTLVGREGVNFLSGDNQAYGVLLVCGVADTRCLVEWPNAVCTVLPKMKPNIVKPNVHFSSCGKCYGFGSAAKYGRCHQNDQLTVAPFVNRVQCELSHNTIQLFFSR